MSQAADHDSNKNTLRFVDIGANLLDERFTAGIYHGNYRHEPDLDLVLQRAAQQGVGHILLTAGTITESRRAVQAVREWRQLYPDMNFRCTVGVHPTRCQQVFVDQNCDDHKEDGDAENNNKKKNPDELLQELLEIAQDGMQDQTVAAIGEIGLDYDRLEFCPKDVQHEYLIKQLEAVAKPTGLPLFLHNRSAKDDLYTILKQHADCWSSTGSASRGVVHSFDDTLELAMKFIQDLNLHIGLNGCSLRTTESLAVVQQIPLDHILLETDCPYCEIRKTHPSYNYIQTHFDAKAEKKYERGKCVKSRQEPCHIVQVAEVIAGCKKIPLAQVADVCYQNSIQCFFS